MSVNVFPKLYIVGKNSKITVSADDVKSVKIRVQGMEAYTVPHKTYRIDEEGRYPFLDMEKDGDSLFFIYYNFKSEQKYRVTVLADGAKRQFDIYAVKKDLSALSPLKGDVHLHTNRSDGEGSPFEVGINFRRAGYDFIAITDHHKLFPSFEGQEEFKNLTDEFFVFHGEEVHNQNMGYFHIINFGGNESVNTVIGDMPDYFESEVAKIKNGLSVPYGVDKTAAAYRIFIANNIRKFGGVAILAHPFWDAYGEYNAQTEDVKFLLEGGYFDAVEVFGGNDLNFNGDNLMAALLSDLKAEGVKVGFVGCSDAHSETAPNSLFNKVFTLVFSESISGVPNAIKNGNTVAVHYRGDGDFWVYGNYRLVKYARFLLKEYFPKYAVLCEKHALALNFKDGEKIRAAEKEIAEFKKAFFA